MESQELISFDNLLNTLNEYRDTVISLYKQKLTDDDHIASRKLIDNVTYVLKTGNGDIELDLNLQDYWKYLEEGTKPHFPPIKAILDWVKIKPVLPSKTYDGKLPTQEQLAFLIARKISEDGTKGTHDLEEAVQQVNEIFEQRIEEAISMDIDEVVVSLLAGL